MIDIKKVKELLDEGIILLNTRYRSSIGYEFVDKDLYYGWYPKVLNYLQSKLPPDNIYLTTIKKEKSTEYRTALEQVKALESLCSDLEEGLMPLNSEANLEDLEKILYKFHKVVSKLSQNQVGNCNFVIKNEYDVQKLLCSLLSIHFDIIIREDSVPNSMGATSRVDFFIKDISTVIEVKMTRKTLKNNELGKQLNDDIMKYPNHYGCDRIYFFVYDPKHLIENPEKFEADFTNNKNVNIDIKTIVVPKL